MCLIGSPNKKGINPLDLAHSLDTASKTCKMVKLLEKAKVPVDGNAHSKRERMRLLRGEADALVFQVDCASEIASVVAQLMGQSALAVVLRDSRPNGPAMALKPSRARRRSSRSWT